MGSGRIGLAAAGAGLLIAGWALLAWRSRGEEIERLKRELELARRKAPPSVSTEPPPQVPATVPGRPSDPVPEPAAPSTSKPAPLPLPAEAAFAKARLLDPSRPAAERVSGLRVLRFTAPGERTPEVVAAMVDLMDRTEDGELRREIVRNLRGVADTRLRAALVMRVEKDEHAGVREEAAESLMPLAAPDAEVRAALERVSKLDPDERVKRRASRSLGSR
jgi:hypothetical protein